MPATGEPGGARQIPQIKGAPSSSEPKRLTVQGSSPVGGGRGQGPGYGAPEPG
jgi:hypothetical protein